jgi:hypothetical protein
MLIDKIVVYPFPHEIQMVDGKRMRRYLIRAIPLPRSRARG